MEQFERAEGGPDYDEFQIDTSFHSYLVEVTGNDILIDLYHSVMLQQMRLANYAAKYDTSNRVGNLAQHRAIIDEIFLHAGIDGYGLHYFFLSVWLSLRLVRVATLRQPFFITASCE